MFGPDYKAGCPSCTSIADSFDGFRIHLANHDVMLWAVSRAPLEKLVAYKKRMGWSFSWASASECEFNTDFNVSLTEDQQRQGGNEYNYRRDPILCLPQHDASAKLKAQESSGEPETNDVLGTVAKTCGVDSSTFLRDRPGMSVFALVDNQIYHTYSAYSRGLDVLWNMYQWLDRTPLGRNETDYWIRRHDEYAM